MQQGMGSNMRLLCLFLSIGINLVYSNKIPKFGLFITPDLYFPSTDKFCLLSTQDLQEYSHISVDLKTSSGSVTLYTVQPDSPTWHCQSFQVPEPSFASEKVTISVQGQKKEGSKIEFSSKELTMRKKSTGTLIQTDKSIYKQGQKVMFRMVTLNQDLEVLNKSYPLVELQDSQKNRVAQWKDVHAKSQIAELSYEMPHDAALGTYSIQTEDAKVYFIVAEYVLPKFDIVIDAPRSISIKDNKVSMSASGVYTHGGKVHGNVTLKVCQKKRPRYWYWWRSNEKDEDQTKDHCYIHNAKTDSSGKLTSEMDLSQFRLHDSDYERKLEVEASLEEEGTDVKSSAPKMTINLESQLTKLSFKETKRYFHPGAPYRGKLVLESYDGKRLSDQKVHLSIRAKGQTMKETYVTDSAGEVSFQLPTSKWGKGSVSLEASTDEKNEPYVSGKVSVRHGRAYLYLNDIHTTAASSVYIQPVKNPAKSEENVMVTVDFTLGEDEKDEVDFYYLGLADNRVTLGGQKTVKKSDSPSGSFQLALPVVDISPSGKLLVFMVSQSGGIALDTSEVQITAPLKHKVSLKFSEDEVLPGSDVQLHLQANGGSMCAVRAVDKSVVMMKPEAELTESKIKNLVPVQKTRIYSQGLDYKYCRDKKQEAKNSEDSDTSDDWGWWGGYSYPEKKKDFMNVIEDFGCYFLTSLDVVAPTTCRWQREITMLKDMTMNKPAMTRPTPRGSIVMDSEATSGGSPMSEKDFDADDVDDGGSSSGPRVLFPATWLWELKEVPKSGSAEMKVSVPDTMTEWSTQMLCAGPGGLGLSPTVHLKSFQPFFIDLTLPYSVKRGESFPLRASVFNYLSHPMMISASLPSSDQFEMKNSETTTKIFCLPAGVKKTISWEVTPTVIGQMNATVIAEAIKSGEQCGEQKTLIPKRGSRDVVIHSVRVVPEGTLEEQTHNSLLISNGNPVSETVKFELPSSYVPGSEKAVISICGDIMGPSMNNIADLLAMSYGCGEQNMVLFAPNIYILKYLTMSNQLNPTVLSKGKDMLEKGHARQLKYMRSDGSFSAFGLSDLEGSTWLTAFVTKTLSQARNLTFIDEDNVKRSMDWLKTQQKPDGCFKATGRLLNNGMKGGVNDEITLTAYIIIALLEYPLEFNDPVVMKAQECIAAESLDSASLYKMSLKSYAFTLAGDMEKRAATLEKLEEKAQKTGGLMYWTQETKPQSESYWSKPNSVNVEMTSYVLLALASSKNPTKKDLGNMGAIVRWLSKQQNPKGGFSSTQDTVVALQALSLYSSKTYSKAGEMTVDVTTKKGFHHRFHVDSGNRLLLQKKQLPEVPGEYTVTVSGNGTIMMQAVQSHNVNPKAGEDAFEMSAELSCVNSNLLQISVGFRYIGKRPSTNMVIMEINMLSGFLPQTESIDKLEKHPMVKRVEKREDAVSIYIEKVTSEPQTLQLQAEQNVPVTGRKPAIISIYDYYMPEERKTISYLKDC
ncbi:alpha-2-macroglobulin-like protein 1 isoform X3 [Engystomops pustulosus]|uniref:alpha-2-macroglobulin-like protein 1 isoform X3 n=1 Tax=Engystomops pustulosus TaxID=76066 RepID=UPI003AFAB22B